MGISQQALQRAEALDTEGKPGRAGLVNLKKKRLRLGELIDSFIYLTGKRSQGLFRGALP